MAETALMKLAVFILQFITLFAVHPQLQSSLNLIPLKQLEQKSAPDFCTSVPAEVEFGDSVDFGQTSGTLCEDINGTPTKVTNDGTSRVMTMTKIGTRSFRFTLSENCDNAAVDAMCHWTITTKLAQSLFTFRIFYTEYRPGDTFEVLFNFGSKAVPTDGIIKFLDRPQGTDDSAWHLLFQRDLTTDQTLRAKDGTIKINLPKEHPTGNFELIGIYESSQFFEPSAFSGPITVIATYGGGASRGVATADLSGTWCETNGLQGGQITQTGDSLTLLGRTGGKWTSGNTIQFDPITGNITSASSTATKAIVIDGGKSLKWNDGSIWKLTPDGCASINVNGGLVVPLSP